MLTYLPGFFGNLTELKEDQGSEDLPKSELCSSCMIQFLEQSQASSFSNYDDSTAESWKENQKRNSMSTSGLATEC
jgi:hypothetical protein